MLFVVVGRKRIMKKTNFAEQLREYMANRTSEQISEDEKLLDKWTHVGPSIKEYFNGLKCNGNG